ncbi:MAG: RICIN domain-containing protein [Clostridia bacterium]|nr:RICIN domain-containing protein [Clostridia bacterium]
MKIKKMFSVTLALALLLQIFALALPVSAETVDETDTSSTGNRKHLELGSFSIYDEMSIERPIVPQSEVPAVLDYSIVQENYYVRRAYEFETSLNEIVFMKTDGALDSYYFAFPVKYVDENGEVRDKAPELTYNASLTAGKYRMTTTSANDNALFCADVASDGLLYTSDALSLSLRPTTAAEHAFALQIALANSDAELQSIGNAVASSLAVIGPVTQAPAGFSAVAQSDFASSALNEGLTSRAARYALSNEAALSVVPSYNGFQVALGLAKNRTQNTYTFALSTGDATLVNQEGTLLLVNDEGDPLGIVGEFVLVDENGTCGTVAPQVTKVIDGEYLLSADLGDDVLVATLSVSQYYDYLQDATIYQANQTSYGSSSRLFVGTLASSSVLGRALIRPNNWYFTSTAYPGYEVQSATLHIRDVMGDDPEVNVEVRPFTGNTWVESTANWNSVGGNSYGAVLDTKTVSPDIGWDASPRYWYQYNITSLVRNWYNGTANPAKGLMIKGDAANEARSDVTEKTFASSQYSNESLRPYITVSLANTVLPDGAYLISARGLYLQAFNNEIGDFARVDTASSMDDPGTENLEFVFRMVWRTVRLSDGSYTLRPMHYTPAALSANVERGYLREVGLDDDLDVPEYGRWNIVRNGNSWSLIPCSDVNKALSLSAIMVGCSQVNIQTQNTLELSQQWSFEAISVPESIFVYDRETGLPVSSTTPPLTMLAGDSVPFSEFGYIFTCSTLKNLPVFYPFDAYTTPDYDENVLEIEYASSGGETCIRANSPGEAELSVEAALGFEYIACTVNVRVSSFDGMYYLKNIGADLFLDVASPSSGVNSALQLSDSFREDSSYWQISHVSDKYYSIRAVGVESQNAYLCIDSAGDPSVELVTGNVSSLPEGLWRIEKTETESYRFISKAEDVLSSGQTLVGTTSNTVQQATYVEDTNYFDEWGLRPYSALIMQGTKNWCWVAAPMMCALKYGEINKTMAGLAVHIVLDDPYVDVPTDDQITKANIQKDWSEISAVYSYLVPSKSIYYRTVDLDGNVIRESLFRSVLDAGNCVILELKDDNGTADIKDDSDHAVVLFDYSYNESTQVYLYDLYDPSDDGCILNNRNIINLAPGESVVAYGYES